MRHILPISGKDSLATAFVQTARCPELPYEFLYNDTEAELPETYAWLAKVEAKTGWSIQRVGKSLPALIELRGGFLPGPRSRYCTRETKIKPMEAWLGDAPATVYYGLRADEVRTGYVPLGKSNITPAYPLQELAIDLQGVYAILQAQDLMPPEEVGRRLYEAVNLRLADWPHWESLVSPMARSVLFSGRTRANCYFCFFQCQYEFLWLKETHPALFETAKGMEKAEYTFQPTLRLADLDSQQACDIIFERRVRDVVKAIQRRVQGSLLELTIDNDIARTSCGLLCGK